MLLKKGVLGARASNFDLKDESHTQHRFKQPLTRIRLLRALCSSPSLSTTSVKIGRPAIAMGTSAKRPKADAWPIGQLRREKCHVWTYMDPTRLQRCSAC